MSTQSKSSTLTKQTNKQKQANKQATKPINQIYKQKPIDITTNTNNKTTLKSNTKNFLNQTTLMGKRDYECEKMQIEPKVELWLQI